MEYNVETAFIDVLLEIDNTCIVVENKIFPGSAQDEFQLQREYSGLKCIFEEKKENKRVFVVFLVPMEGDTLHKNIQAEFAGLRVQDPDQKAILTWQKTQHFPSVNGVLESIIQKEHSGDIDPISEYARHTIKALRKFISDEFSGYEYEKDKKQSGDNPLTEERITMSEIFNKTNGFIGVKDGLSGLLRNLSDNSIAARTYQFTTQDMSTKSNWMPLSSFKTLMSFFANEQIEFTWDQVFGKSKIVLHSLLIFELAKRKGPPFYVGIKGGEQALLQFSVREIQEKRWGVSVDKETNQFVEKERFREILEGKFKEKGITWA